jgi:cysteine desulfurase/selenocysteine lyase
VFPDRVEYNALPWKYAAGTPNILGAIVSAEALRLLVDLALTPERPEYFGTARPLERSTVQTAMNRVSSWNQQLASRALEGLGSLPGLTIYGPREAARRTSLVAFNLVGRDPVSVADALNQAGVESRAGCHCATLAHHALRLTPPASCRLSFYLYNTPATSTRPWPRWPPSAPATARRRRRGTGAGQGGARPGHPSRPEIANAA